MRVDVRTGPSGAGAGGRKHAADVTGGGAGIVDVNLRVVPTPVSQVDRAQEFCGLAERAGTELPT
jgi:hypothetical protein